MNLPFLLQWHFSMQMFTLHVGLLKWQIRHLYIFCSQQNRGSPAWNLLTCFLFFDTCLSGPHSLTSSISPCKRRLWEKAAPSPAISLPLSFCVTVPRQCDWLTLGIRHKWKGEWYCPMAFCTRQGLGLRKRVASRGYLPDTGVLEKELQFLQPQQARPGHQSQYTP